MEKFTRQEGGGVKRQQGRSTLTTKEVIEIFRKKKLSIAERQKRLNQICKMAEYVAPIIVSAAAATVFSLMVLR